MNAKEININFLKKLALIVENSVTSLIGTKEGAKKLKKGKGGDISMQIDLVAENSIIEELRRKDIDIMLLSEEVGEIIIGNREIVEKNEYKLIIDPIDGSNNSIRNIPFFCVSIAYAKGSKVNDIEKAVIFDLNTKDIYWAEKGKGAFLNDKKISVSNNYFSDQLIFEIDFELKDVINKFEKYKSILQKIYKIRIMGSVALSFCLLSRGSTDGYINLRENMRLVDIAAAYLIFKEAGGKILSINGEELDINLSMDPFIPIIACVPNLEDILKEELRKINIAFNK